MTHRSESQTRNPSRTRRLSSCYLHPADPATGICASCLRERLCGLDSSVDDPGPSSSSSSSFIPSLNNGGFAGATSPALRRCRSVFVDKCEAFTSFHEPRRKSCDVGARNGKSLSHLFDVDDEECSGSSGRSKVESRNIIRGGGVVELGVENQYKNGGEIRDFHGGLQGIGNGQEDDNVDEGEVKTMKEYIDLELQSKSQKLKDFKELTGSIRGAASVFSKKLQKWRQKQKKKLSHGGNVGGIGGGSSEMDGPKGQKLGETQSEAADYYGVGGRRSCDTDPRFSVDAGRLSVDGGRISFDEPRASWDGYLIARTIPRLTPMLSVVDDAMLSGGNRIEHHHRHRVSVDGQMQSIMEDESSSGSGGSAQSNSDSWSSQRRSSFDRSSSVRSFGKKMVGLEGDYARGSPAKLVITERELKDWHLNSMKDNHMNKSEAASKEDSTTGENRSNLGSKKPIRWRKVLNVFGFKQKSCETKSEKSSGDSMDCSPALACEKQEKELDKEVKDTTGWKLMRSNSIVGARRSCEVIRLSGSQMRLADDADCTNRSMEEYVLGRNLSAKYASSNLDDGVLPFYLTPLRSSRSTRSGRNKLQNSHFVHGNILQLN